MSTPLIPAPRPHIGLSTPPPMPWETAPVLGRSNGRRIAMFLGMVGGILLACGIVGAAFTWNITPEEYATKAEYDAAMNVGCIATSVVCLPLFIALFAALAPKVGYRRRDSFFVLVPVWSYVFIARVLWRVTSLPYRYWTPRVEEMTADYDHNAHVANAPKPYFDLFDGR